MNSLECTLVTKAGYDHGWEVVVEATGQRVLLASALHCAQVDVLKGQGVGERWRVRTGSAALAREPCRALGAGTLAGDAICIFDRADTHGPDYPTGTFRDLKANELREFGEYRTRRLVLAAWDTLSG